MTRQTAFAALVTCVIAGVIGFLLSNSGARASAPLTTASAVATSLGPVAATFVQPGEAVVGPAVIVATDISLHGEQVIVDFDLESLAPVGDAATVRRLLGFQSVEDISPQDLDTVYPDAWTLVTPTVDIPGTVANPSARAARFDVGPNFDLGSIEEVQLASYALLLPIDTSFSLDLSNDTAPVAPGVTARLLAVTEQALTIVQVEVLSERSFNYDNIRISGSGPGWKSAVREAEGRPRWNLTYDSPTAPSPIELRISGAVWVTIDNDSTILVESTS